MERLCIVLGIIFVIIVIIGAVYCYSGVNNNICPICGAEIEYQGKIIHDSETYFRYACTNNPLHYFDFLLKIK